MSALKAGVLLILAVTMISAYVEANPTIGKFCTFKIVNPSFLTFPFVDERNSFHQNRIKSFNILILKKKRVNLKQNFQFYTIFRFDGWI